MIEQRKTKDNQGKDFIPLKIDPERARFSDCCNAVIIAHRCPKCGAYLEDDAGRREIQIKGLDGKTSHRSPDILLSVIDDKPKAKDPMPRHFKDMQRHGVKILTWSDSSTNTNI
jgi:hypothetical protein